MNALRNSLALCLAIALTVSIWPATVGAQRRPMAPADILRVATVGDPQISPNGDWVVYTVSTTEGEQTVSTLWLVRAGERLSAIPPTSRQPEQRRNWELPRNPGRPLLPAGWSAVNPRWSPDGKSIAFLSNHDGQHGIWVSGPERRIPRFVAAVRETNFFITYAGESLAWSPDSKMIAYVSASEETDQDSLDGTSKNDDPRVIDRIQYKSRTSFSDRLRTHVWLTDVDQPQPRQLTSGPFYDHALSFSPGGDEIAFISNHETDPDANNNSDIFATNLQGQVRQITQTAGCEYEPTWSPDGKRIAYVATRRDVTTIDSVAEDTHVWVIDAGGGAGRDIIAMDRRARNPRWSPDSQGIFFLANDRGLTRIHHIDLRCFKGSECIDGFPDTYPALVKNQLGNSVALALPDNFQISSYSQSAGTSSLFAFTLSDSTHPVEVWTGIFGRKETMRRLTAHNDAVVGSVDLVEPQNISYKSIDGTQIDGWLMKPLGWHEDRKYPMILSVHGGPHGMYGYAFNPTFQVYAARGYAVLYLNPRGSSGYGQKFSDGTIDEWGGGDYRDLMAGVDEALRRYSWIDANRLGVTGGSYGGFMTNWIITQTPRFKAAVSAASVSNLVSFYSTSLYQDLIHAEFGGFPWDNYDLLWQWSPLRYVKQAQTPTLFIHGEQDNDVHITQAEEMYMALRRRGVETVLVRYPREGHGLREPRHRVDALERTLAWFDRFLK
jgi:dipeptidyl aminopeptidase/acylaminoacyl peptidase